ncbi:Peroxisome assembly protein 22 [Debaryomyces fabryi]|uniref:Peroxisome assembly protein 22 n=1 Tax=Debaryomyces fabryi TaxID=58627 RepID=A0A0V1Q389_9ASCO|nr:Peroxisome assembly protein 22 [Debaryomyces fabryi]KSA02639.1 Peroxisome assembly protein 22 [Debaryomyces fabryi]CUM45750.1 unnamed protein product [Debaryomyces fabryi]
MPQAQIRKTQRNPKVWVAALIAASIVTISYKMYSSYIGEETVEDKRNEKEGAEEKLRIAKKYTKKSIALTLSHSVLSSQLPLNEILLNSENVTFILPPNLSMDDLVCNIGNADEVEKYNLPKTLLNNYKLLHCSNIDGYFNILKNLKPDTLLVCSDDLGIADSLPRDLHRFVKEVINIDQNKEDIYKKLSSIFIK